MGLFFRKTAPSADLLKDGIRGKARVEHVEESRWSMEVNVRKGKVDDVMSGEEARSARSSRCSSRCRAAIRTRSS